MNIAALQSAVINMKQNRRSWGRILLCVALLGCGVNFASAASTNTLAWDKEKGLVSADVRDWELLGLLEAIANQTGWHVFVEPDYNFKSSVKFKDLPPGQALRRLLGEMNFAMMPQTNGPQRLYVFRTEMNNAKTQVRSATARSAPKAKRVPNELIIRVKPGTDIEALAKALGAKIVGSIPELNAYRLQFEDEEATEAARQKLLANPDVTSVQDNYYVDNPLSPQSLGGIAAPEAKLTLDPPKTDDCKVVVGFVDTALQRLDPKLESFITERVSVAGQSALDATSPTHSTAMFNAFIQAMQSSGKASTSVRVLSVDVFGSSGAANTFNVALGLITAGNKGATVINASLGGYGDSPILRDAVQQLALHNIPVFAAVGNDGSSTPFFPAAYPEVISVTALERGGKIASYANTGTQPDAAAPGAVIFSHNGLIYASQGTSVSSAAATGIAAGLADSICAPWTKVIPAVEKSLAVPTAK
jgi:serine protease